MNCTREMNIDIHIRTFTYEDPFDESYDMTAILHTHIANHKKMFFAAGWLYHKSVLCRAIRVFLQLLANKSNNCKRKTIV